MVRIVYWKCDRCGRVINNAKDIEMMTLIKKTQEFCKECAEDFKVWYKKGVKNDKRINI